MNILVSYNIELEWLDAGGWKMTLSKKIETRGGTELPKVFQCTEGTPGEALMVAKEKLLDDLSLEHSVGYVEFDA